MLSFTRYQGKVLNGASKFIFPQIKIQVLRVRHYHDTFVLKKNGRKNGEMSKKDRKMGKLK